MPRRYGFVHVRTAPAILYTWAVADVIDAGEERPFEAGFGIGASTNILEATNVFANADPLLVEIVNDNGPISKTTGSYTAAFKIDLSVGTPAGQHTIVVGFGDDTLDEVSFFGIKRVYAGIVAINSYASGIIDGYQAFNDTTNIFDIPETGMPVPTIYAQLFVNLDAGTGSVKYGETPEELLNTVSFTFTPSGATHLRCYQYMLSEDYTSRVTAYLTTTELESAGFDLDGFSSWVE